VLVPLSEESVTGLPLHDAVTPAGKPLTLRVTAPLNVPFPQASPVRNGRALPNNKRTGGRGLRQRWRVNVTAMGKVVLVCTCFHSRPLCSRSNSASMNRLRA